MPRISRVALFFGLIGLAASAKAQVSTPAATPVAAGSLVVKVGTSILTGVNVTTGATAGYLMVFDAAAVPADGAVSPRKCVPVAATTGIDINWRASPLYLKNGAVLVFSSGANCFTKVLSATAFLSGDIQ